MPVLRSNYAAPRWLPGAHLQTVIPARFFPRPPIAYRRELIDMPDGDFMLFDWSKPEPLDPLAPIVVHFHGLEGSSQSHYAEALMAETARRGWRGVVALFRGCGGPSNRLPRAYFAGDTADCEWALQTVHQRFAQAPVYAVGVSLGGNQLARFLGERGSRAAFLSAAVSIGAPLDLVAGSEVMSKGANKLYSEMFLSTLKQKLLDKAVRFPGILDLDEVKACRTIYDFDRIYTAPIHGFASPMEYWTRCSAKPVLPGVQVPLLLINALNDPFLPAWALPGERDVSPRVFLEYSQEGGHVGFPRGNPPGDLMYLPERAFAFFEQEGGAPRFFPV